MDTRGINSKYIHSLRLYTIMVWNPRFKNFDTKEIFNVNMNVWCHKTSDFLKKIHPTKLNYNNDHLFN